MVVGDQAMRRSCWTGIDGVANRTVVLQQGFVVRGVVSDQQTGMPIAGARATICGCFASDSRLTNADGEFLTVLPWRQESERRPADEPRQTLH